MDIGDDVGGARAGNMKLVAPSLVARYWNRKAPLEHNLADS